MFGENLEKIDNLLTLGRIEICLKSENDFENLKKWLVPSLGEEGADQCVFVLKSMVLEDFTNHCNEATQELGKRLSGRFGDEESFFEIIPNSDYYQVRSEKPLTKIGYAGKFHSVGLLELSSPEDEKNSLVFDLTYSDLGKGKERGAVLLLKTSGNREKAFATLENNYGGKWEIDYILNKEKGTFVLYEG